MDEGHERDEEHRRRLEGSEPASESDHPRAEYTAAWLDGASTASRTAASGRQRELMVRLSSGFETGREIFGLRAILLVLPWVLAAACSNKSGGSSAVGQDAGDDASSDAGEDGEAGGPPDVAWFQEVPSTISGVDVTHAPDLNLPFSGGIGVAAGDIDGDGKPDLVAPSGLGPTLVFHNLGSWRFSDITSKSGVDGRNVANGATLCDIDGDGKLDLFLSTDEPRTDSNVFFFKGNGDGTFTDRTTAAGFAPLSAVSSVVCTDLDGDGLLDVYVSAYAFIGKSGFPGRQDSFYRNRGDGTFVDSPPRWGWTRTG